MRKIALFFLFLTLWFGSSCSSIYQVYVVAENTDLTYTPLDGFVKDFDSVKVYFSFAGDNMPLRITIDNQSSKALHLDWNKTAFILDGFLLSVVNPDSRTDITAVYTEFWDGETSVSMRVSRNSELPMKFIPPKTKYQFRVRKFVEFAPDFAQIDRIPTLYDKQNHPQSSAIDQTIFRVLEDEYPDIRVIMHMQFSDMPEKVLQVDEFFYMTRQYKVKMDSQDRQGVLYADRGFYTYSEPSQTGTVFGIMGLFAGTMLLVVALTSMP